MVFLGRLALLSAACYHHNMPAVAFLTLPAIGHVNPTLAVVAELAHRGCDVIYFAPEDMRARIEGAGACWVDRPRRAASGGPAVQGPSDEAVRRLPYLMAAVAGATVPPLVEGLVATRPDVVACNELDLTARLSARAARLRAATFRPFHAAPRSGPRAEVTDDLANKARRGLADWAAKYDLPPTSLDEAMRGNERLRLVFLPRRFQTMAEAFDSTHLFVGPSLVQPAELPWLFPPRPGSRPRRVYISLGTLRNDHPGFYRLCFEAFAGPEWQVVMSIGERTDRAALGLVPANIDVRSFVPQLALLAQTDVFVTHGGLNSVMEAMWSGVPVVVLPEIEEQRTTGNRVAELKLGVALEREGLTADLLRFSVEQVGQDPQVGMCVQAMRKDVREAGGAPRAAEALLQLVQ
ncbi:MAG: glycosyl transferase [Verrucomicrobia bacterium]|nr:glycosyl transferase [Verrucomicrobiota bacterium]